MDIDKISKNIIKSPFLIIAVIIFIIQLILQNFLSDRTWIIFTYISAPTVLVLLAIAIFVGISKTKDL